MIDRDRIGRATNGRGNGNPIKPPICPNCNIAMTPKETTKFARKPGEIRKFWSCPYFPRCRVTVGAHPDGTPLGNPAPDKETKEARIRAHSVFDPIWQNNILSRNMVYRYVSEIMGIHRDDCHVGNFNIEECEKFILAANILLNRISGSQNPQQPKPRSIKRRKRYDKRRMDQRED